MLKIDGSLARNIDFEVANFEVHKKTRRKTSILKLQNVKIGGVSHEMLVLNSSNMSRLEVLVFCWRRCVFGGS